MLEVEYLTDKNAKPRAVVIPIELWNKLLPKENISIDDLSESIEDYCLSKAMDEGQKTPLLNREEALKYLEE
jgi:hypothetical protein